MYICHYNPTKLAHHEIFIKSLGELSDFHSKLQLNNNFVQQNVIF